jgi:hypothetical protein
MAIAYAPPASAVCAAPDLTPRLEILERTCVAGAPCTLPVLLDLAATPDAEAVAVASATVTSDMDFDCNACTVQSPAGAGACNFNVDTCAGVIGDFALTTQNLGEGAIAEIIITCNAPGTHTFDLDNVSFGGLDGLPLGGCGRATTILCTQCDGSASCGSGQTCNPISGACVDEPAAIVSITDSADLSGSTFSSGSMSIINQSGASIEIDSVRIDLRPTILPDMVFDPSGVAGDVVAKCLTAGTAAASVGYVDPADPCVDPFSSPHDGGFDIADLAFTDFQPGEQFKFAVDIDPTSIQGTAAAAGAGAVAGVELSGARYTVGFSDGSSISGRLFRTPSSAGGSTNEIRFNGPGAPSLEALDSASVPDLVLNRVQTLRLRGLTPGATARVLQLETEMDLNGRTGFTPEAFEGNRALSVAEYSAVADSNGIAEVTATLTRSAAGGGINYFQAVEVDGDGSGRTGANSNVVVLELDHCATDVDCNDLNPCTDDVCDETGTCLVTPNAAACDDGLYCTDGDTCTAGICTGSPRQCADADVCTVDGCDEDSDSCTHGPAPDGALCDDGRYCTVSDTCTAGVCGGQPRDCSDGNPCTVDGCLEAFNECTNPPVTNNVLCDDGISCTASDVCTDGVCIGSDDCPAGESCDLSSTQCVTSASCATSAECNDGNACTDDDCVNGFCSHPPNAAPCDDGQYCTVDDTCSGGSCQGEPMDCSDGVDCTTDVCNEALQECIPVPRDVNCDDGLFCNGVENCDQAAGCLPGTPVDCSTADSVCGAGFCDEAAGTCSINPLNDGASCDDGDPCSASETCNGGECSGPMTTNVSTGKFKMKSKPGEDDDKLTLTMKMALADFNTDPSEDGAGFTILGCDRSILYASDIPAGGLVDLKGDGSDIRFSDKNGFFSSARGLRLLRFRHRRRTAEVKIQARLGRGDLDGSLDQTCADVSIIIGQPADGACIGGFDWTCKTDPGRLRCNLD